MSTKVHRRWSPIEPLSPELPGWENPELRALVDQWQAEKSELETQKEYGVFLERMRRQWAIETGVLERLYSISKAATKTLIEKGFDASLISHDDTDRPLGEVLALIKDQHSAIESLYQFVKGDRPLGTSYVKELHKLLTQHQDCYEIIDSLGRTDQRPLLKGDWKQEPNYVEFSEGGKVEFCPPQDVDPEMRRLLEFYEEYEKRKVPPDVLAAWLHHRFVLIHPFADGNGRVARCLATLVLLKPGWFPLVVTRDDKPAYIKALRNADEGNLKPLVDFFGELQQKAIREAFSISEEITEGSADVRDIFHRVARKWESEQTRLKENIFRVAESLRLAAEARLKDIANDANEHLKKFGIDFNARVDSAECGDQKSNNYYDQVVQTANKLNYYANRSLYHSWVALKIETKIQTEILFSFHGLGRSVGTLVCAGAVFVRAIGSGGQEHQLGDVTPICEQPFAFSHLQEADSVLPRFQEWLERCIVRGLDEWRKLEGA